MSSSARVYGAIQVLHGLAGLATHDMDHLQLAAHELDPEERDAIERGCQRFIEQCIRIREDAAAVAPPHRSDTAMGAMRYGPCTWAVNNDCHCPIGRDHWQDREGTRLMGVHLEMWGEGIQRMQQVCRCAVGRDHEQSETKETPWPSSGR